MQNTKKAVKAKRETDIEYARRMFASMEPKAVPETRTADLKGHINYDEKLGCWCIGDTPIDPQLRTIPAEKPTAPTHVELVHVRQDLTQRLKVEQQDHQRCAHKLLAAQAHAAQLAEALQMVTNGGWLIEYPQKTQDAVKQALAAYEESR